MSRRYELALEKLSAFGQLAMQRIAVFCLAGSLLTMAAMVLILALTVWIAFIVTVPKSIDVALDSPWVNAVYGPIVVELRRPFLVREETKGDEGQLAIHLAGVAVCVSVWGLALVGSLLAGASFLPSQPTLDLRRKVLIVHLVVLALLSPCLCTTLLSW